MKAKIVKFPYFATVWFIASLVRGIDLAFVLFGTLALYATDMLLGHFLPAYAEVMENGEEPKAEQKQPDKRLVS